MTKLGKGPVRGSFPADFKGMSTFFHHHGMSAGQAMTVTRFWKPHTENDLENPKLNQISLLLRMSGILLIGLNTWLTIHDTHA